MNTSDLKIFLEVVKNNSFSIAADELYLAQSSVSKAIKRLEDELDVRLFVRHHSSIEITPAGKELYNGISNLMPEFNRMIRHIRTTANNCPVEVVYMIPLMKFNLSELFSQFKLHHPDIRLSLNQYDTMESAIEILQAYPPITLMYSRNKYSHLYDYIKLYPDSLLAVIQKNSSFSSLEALSINNIKNKTIFVTNSSSNHFLKELCANAGIIPKIMDITTTGPRREIAIRKVNQGQGIAVMYQSDLEVFKLENLKVLPIREIPETPLVLGILKDHMLSANEQILVKYLTAAIKENAYTNVL